jgi:hypothetical protein
LYEFLTEWTESTEWANNKRMHRLKRSKRFRRRIESQNEIVILSEAKDLYRNRLENGQRRGASLRSA